MEAALIISILIASMFFISLVGAQLEIGQELRDDLSVDIISPEIPTNFSIQNVNSSDFWDGLDTPLDITQMQNFSLDTAFGNFIGNFTGNFNGTWNGSTNFVPYLGATKDVDLGKFNLTTTGYAHLQNVNVTGNVTVEENVGIGSITPDTKLYVKSNDNTVNNNIAKFISNNEGQYTALTFNKLRGSFDLKIATESAQPMSFLINNVEKMRLDADGDLGIGATNPFQRLVVAGDINLTNKLVLPKNAFITNDTLMELMIGIDNAGTEDLDDIYIGGIDQDGGDRYYNIQRILLYGESILLGDTADGADTIVEVRGTLEAPDIDSIGVSSQVYVNHNSFDAGGAIANAGVVSQIRETANSLTYGGWFAGQYDGSASFSSTVYGLQAFSYLTGIQNSTRTALPGANAGLYGVRHLGDGRIAWAANIATRGIHSGGGNITLWDSIAVLPPAISAGSKIDEFVGLHIYDMTAGTDNWAIKTGLGQVEFGDNTTIKGNLNQTLGNATINMIYGEMHFHNDTVGNLTPLVEDVWATTRAFGQEYKGNFLNGFSQSANFTVLFAQRVGLYKVDYSITGTGSVNNRYHFVVSKNSVQQLNTETHNRISTGSDVIASSGTGFIDIVIGDQITLQIMNEDSSGDYLVNSANINLIRIGD